MGTFEIFEHTADVGLIVRASTWEDLLATAARATFDQMLVDRPAEVEAYDEVQAVPMRGLEGDRAELLVVWLQELLFRFETRRWAPLVYEFEAAAGAGVRARVGFGAFDPKKHRSGLEIKAVTYHELDVHQEPDGTWLARFILDV